MNNILKHTNCRSEYKFLIAISLLWFFVQAILYYQIGLITTDEASKYIREASLLINGQTYTSSQFILYSTYIFFIALCQKIQIGFTGVYLIQTVLSGTSMYYFYQLCKKISPSLTAARIGVFLLIICFPYQSWNTHLYTESFFLSLTIIFLNSYFKYGIKNYLTITLIIALLFARPTGILSIAAVLIHFSLCSAKNKKFKLHSILFLTGILVLIIISINNFLSIGGSFDFSRPFIEGHIICDVPSDLSNKPDQTTIKNPNSIQGITELIIRNPTFFSELFYRRTISFFGMTREHYSNIHNLLLICFFYPLYIATFISLFQLYKRNKNLLLFLILYIGLFYISVVMSCDDWLNRFVMPIVPLLIIATINSNFRNRRLSH